MGDQIYNFLIYLLSYSDRSEEQRMVSAAITDIMLIISFLWIAGVIIWLNFRSVLVRNTPIFRLFAILLIACAFRHAGDLFAFPLILQITVDFLTSIIALATAFIFFQRRHIVLGVVFQFKYVVGLLKTLDKLEKNPDTNSQEKE